MKITDKYLSILPHLCVAWDQVSSIHGENLANGQVSLSLHLLSGKESRLPPVESSIAERIFLAFQSFQEKRDQIRLRIRQLPIAPESPLGLAMPISLIQNLANPLSSMEQIASNLKHNPQMSELPPLPHELLEKIAQTTRTLYQNSEISDAIDLPQPEPGCHCLHCQVARAVQGGMEHADMQVSEEDLKFTQWHIQANGPDNYFVTSAADPSERYRVQLKPSVYCSCEQPACPHIEAVLRS